MRLDYVWKEKVANEENDEIVEGEEVGELWLLNL